MTSFKSISPDQLITISSLVSIAVSEDLSSSEINVLSAFFQSVSDSLALKASQLEYLESQEEIKKQMHDLESQLDTLRRQLKL